MRNQYESVWKCYVQFREKNRGKSQVDFLRSALISSYLSVLVFGYG